MRRKKVVRPTPGLMSQEEMRTGMAHLLAINARRDELYPRIDAMMKEHKIIETEANDLEERYDVERDFYECRDYASRNEAESFVGTVKLLDSHRIYFKHFVFVVCEKDGRWSIHREWQ